MDAQKARQIARSILADGSWKHNHYNSLRMEDMITKVLVTSTETPNSKFVPLWIAQRVYKAAQQFFYDQRIQGFIHNTEAAVNLKAGLYDMDKWTGFECSRSDKYGVLAESSSGTYRVAERVTPAGHYITHPGLYETEQAARDAIKDIRRKESQIP